MAAWTFLTRGGSPAGEGERSVEEDGGRPGTGHLHPQGGPLKKLLRPASCQEAVLQYVQRHIPPPSGWPARPSASIAAVRHPHPPDRDDDACGNWQRSGGASASCGCMSCYGVKGCGESQTDGKGSTVRKVSLALACRKETSLVAAVLATHALRLGQTMGHGFCQRQPGVGTAYPYPDHP